MNQIIYLTINFCCIPYKLVCYITGEYIENNFFFFFLNLKFTSTRVRCKRMLLFRLKTKLSSNSIHFKNEILTLMEKTLNLLNNIDNS